MPDRVKMFVWRMFNNGLPTCMNLRKRDVNVDVGCVFCGQDEEDSMHLFMQCWWARAIWNSINITFSEEEHNMNWPKEFLWTVFEKKKLIGDSKDIDWPLGKLDEQKFDLSW